MRMQTIELHAPHPALLASRALPLERAIARVCQRLQRPAAMARRATCRGRRARQPGDPRWPPT